MSEDAATWDALYDERDQVWSGQPNAGLVREVSGLTPGSALDLGCGEGADAVWLATRGWRVLGVDISALATSRAIGAALNAGVAGRAQFETMDLADTLPPGEFDLVTAQYVHTHGGLDVLDLVRRAARIVATGGSIVVAVHAQPDGDADHDHQHVGPGRRWADGFDLRFPNAMELGAAIRTAPGDWTVVTDATVDSRRALPDGSSASQTDLVVHMRRHSPGMMAL